MGEPFSDSFTRRWVNRQIGTTLIPITKWRVYKVSSDKPLSGTSGGRSGACANASVKTHFNVQHMLAAAYFARKVLDIESNHTDLVDGEPYFAHRGYVTGAVLSAVASLETTVNDLYIDAQAANSPTFEGVDPIVPALLAEYWEEIESARILRKYQLALILARKSKFDQGTSPYQEVDSLIQLRNSLVHYKPEWDTAQREHRKIESRLQGRFRPNPFTGPNDAFFPKKCLGHGCAEWAIKSGVTFIEEFFSRLGLSSMFRNYPQELLRTR